MISKISSKTIQGLTKTVNNKFSLTRPLFDFIYRDNKGCKNYQNAIADPSYPIADVQGAEKAETGVEYNVTKLSNGINVLTESAFFPSNVDIGILVDIGTRDECNETSGSLLSIKNTYFKTVLNTNETVNYGVIQQSGGQFDMSYDQESTYFGAHCLSHDVVDVFGVVADCALEPRSVVASEIGAFKNQETHKLDALLKTGESFNDAIFKTAFGLKGLGLPLKGLNGNIKNLTHYTLQKFQLENITPNKIYVCGAGVENHGEFVDLVSDKLGHIPAVVGQSKGRTASEYQGGEVRNLSESSALDLALVFQSASWQGDYAVFSLANTLINQVVSKNVLNNNHFVDAVQGINSTFSDSGLFGVRVSGSSNYSSDILKVATSTLKSLASGVNEADLSIAKAVLKNNIAVALERSSDRLEESAKNYRSFDKIVTDDYNGNIDSITASQVSAAIATVLQGAPTFVAQGSGSNNLDSYDAIRNSLA